jgi:cytochrome c oxidase subunit 4
MSEHDAARAEHAEEGVSARGLLATLVALMLLAGLSLALRFAHLGELGLLVAMAIAAVKAVLVGLIFMELAFEKPSMRFALAVGLALVAVLLSLMIADVTTRRPAPLAPPPGNEPRHEG